MTDPTPVPRNPDLDFLVTYKGYFLEFYDPEGKRLGFPTFPYHCAPDGLVTRRQLRAANLRPGGQPVIAQILWRHKNNTRIAYLYRRDLAKPKREPSQAQLIAVSKALLARRTCRTCRQAKDYYIPRRSGECLDCNPEVN